MPEGDIDTLSNRIAHIRTRTFAANRPDWLADPEHWQGVTRVVEDKLSDALHERLTEQFVDRRTSVLMRRLRENTALETDIGKDGEVVVESTPSVDSTGSVHRRKRRHRLGCAGAGRGRTEGCQGRDRHPARRDFRTPPTAGNWCSRPRASSAGSASPSRELAAGEDVLKPRVRIIADEHLTGAPRDAVQARLDLWLKSHIEQVLEDRCSGSLPPWISRVSRARRYLSTQRGARRARPSEGCRRDQGARPTFAMATLRKHGVRFGAHHLRAGAAEAGSARPVDAAVGAQARRTPRGWRRSSSSPAAATSTPIGNEIAKVLYRFLGTASAASVRYASTYSNSWPISFLGRRRGAPGAKPRVRSTASGLP